MSESYSRWYREGTASITKNSDILTGANTYWLNANIKPGDMLTFDGSKFYEIESVDTNIQITIKTPFLEDTKTNALYSVIRNFSSTLAADTAAKVVDLVDKHERYIDTEMQTINGKSAYEIATQDEGYVGTKSEWLESLTAYGIAKKNGYVGSESQWLDYLIGAGKWNELSTTVADIATRTTDVETLCADVDKRCSVFNPLHNLTNLHNLAGVHSSIYRGKWLGPAPTDAQWEAIKSGTFNDIWLGDYWAAPLPEQFRTYKKTNTSEDGPDKTRGIFLNEKYNHYVNDLKIRIASGSYAGAWDGLFGQGSQGNMYINGISTANYGSNIRNQVMRWQIVDIDHFLNAYSGDWYWKANAGCDTDTGPMGYYFKGVWGNNIPGTNQSHHIIVMPSCNYSLTDASKFSLENGYYGSGVRAACEILQDIATAVFGESHLYYTIERFSTACDENNHVTSWAYKPSCVEIPSETQIFGTRVNAQDSVAASETSTGTAGYPTHRQFKAYQQCYTTGQYMSAWAWWNCFALYTGILRDPAKQKQNWWCCAAEGPQAYANAQGSLRPYVPLWGGMISKPSIR